MKRIMAVLLAVVLLSGILTACNTTPESSSATSVAAEGSDVTDNALTGKLVLWSQWNETETQGQVFQEYADEYMQLHENVEIEIQWCGRDIDKVLKTAIDGGETIDIFDYPMAYRNSLEDQVIDLTELMTKAYSSTDGKPFNEIISPNLPALARAQTKTPDKQLAIAYQPFMYFFMYNASLFEQAGISTPPTTWEELDAACAKLKELGVSPITFDDFYATYLAGAYLGKEKGTDFIEQLISDSTGELWRDEAVVKMAKAFEDFAQKGYFDENVAGNKYPAGQIDVGTGKAAMYYNGTWLPNEIRDTAGPDFKWGAFTFPDTIEGKHEAEMTAAGGCCQLAISSACKNPELAMDFIAFIYSPENDQKMAELTASIPSGAQTEWPSLLEGIKPAFEKVTDVKDYAYGIEGNPDITPIIAENFINLCAGKISADQFVENMVAGSKN